MKPLPDHRQTHFPPIVGPLKVRFWDMRPYRRLDCKLEAHCHRCKWSFMFWTEAECKAALLEHLWNSDYQSPDSKDVLGFPGR